MYKQTKKIASHPLISGSVIIFIGSFAANIGNYIYNLSMGRMLSAPAYSELLALISIVVLLAVFQMAINNIFAKFAAQYTAANDKDSLVALKRSGLKIVTVASLILFLILISLTGVVNNFLHIDNPHVWIITSIVISFSIMSAYTLGILQGQMKFFSLSGLSVVGVIAKLCIGILLVYLGWGVIGGIFGFLAFYLIPFIIVLPFVFSFKRVTGKINENIIIREFTKNSFPFIVATLGITFLQSGDVILVRNLLSPVEAGQYAALSLMGKAIFYITTPIYFVFFPLIAHKREKKEKLIGTLMLAAVIISGCSAFLSFLYFTFPSFIVHLFFPEEIYAATIPYLGFFSLYVLVFSLAYLLNNFFLSTGKTNVWRIDLLACILFIILTYSFHDNFTQIIADLFITSFLLLTALCIYYKTNGSD